MYTVYIQNTVYELYGIICILSPTWHVDTRPPTIILNIGKKKRYKKTKKRTSVFLPLKFRPKRTKLKIFNGYFLVPPKIFIGFRSKTTRFCQKKGGLIFYGFLIIFVILSGEFFSVILSE